MKSSTLPAKLYDLGITPSRGRPRVSNDNPYSEPLFRTLKYCPQWPESGFADLDTARIWVRDFIAWYNHEHRHSRIRFVTPAQRHRGEGHALLAKRHGLYEAAKARNPAVLGAFIWRPTIDYEDLVSRDKASLDIFWLRDESLEDADNLPAPELILQEIMEDLEGALAQLREMAGDWGG